MAWWTESFQWVLSGIGAAVLILLGRWVLRRFFSARRKPARRRHESGGRAPRVQGSRDETVIATRPRAGAGGATLLKLSLGSLAGALVVVGLLYAIALLRGVPITALPAPLVISVVGSAAALWSLVAIVYWLGRMAMRRRARQFGVKAGPGVSSYEHSLVFLMDPMEALEHSRAALLALARGVEIDSDGEAPDELVGRTGGSERSFGEIVRVRVQSSGARRAAIEIQSRPATWQLFDGGINAENVAEVARYLEARASRAEPLAPVSDEARTREDTVLTTWDWLALAYLAAVAGYTGLLNAMKELWPDSYAAWAGWLDAFPIDPLRLVGHPCPTGDLAAGHPIVLQLNILILPTFLAYSAYNTAEFRGKRDRMDVLNWILCLGSLVLLPLLVLSGCSADWAGELTPKYRALVRFMLEESAGGALYALLLVILINGVSYLSALLMARILGTDSQLRDRRR